MFFQNMSVKQQDKQLLLKHIQQLHQSCLALSFLPSFPIYLSGETNEQKGVRCLVLEYRSHEFIIKITLIPSYSQITTIQQTYHFFLYGTSEPKFSKGLQFIPFGIAKNHTALLWKIKHCEATLIFRGAKKNI